MKAALGPSIQKQSCEVGEEFKEYFPNELSVEGGKLYLDVPQANINQLLDAGVKKENIFALKEDTYSDEKYFSYRRDGDKAGRMIHVMLLKS